MKFLLEEMMTNGHEQSLPTARQEGLLVETLADEVLVYDLNRKKAHCLNQSAAKVWEHCDGRTTIKEIASRLQTELTTPVGEDVVWFALDQLEKRHLLQDRLVRPAGTPDVSRRDLIRKIGFAVSVPLVVSILAPKASAALSCVGINCVGNPSVCGACTCNGTTCQ